MLKKIVLASALILGFIAVGALSWTLCALTHNNGQIHVVNSLSQDQQVIIGFPSGHQERFEIKSEGSYTFKQIATGEGSLKVTLNGQEIPCDSYVTSINPLMILTLRADKALLTSHFH